MRTLGLFSVLAVQWAFAGPVSAATLEVLNGTVTVTRGQNATRAPGTSEVKAGDVVTTGAGSRARIIYSPTCAAIVEPATSVTVLEDLQCAAGLGDNTLLIGGAVVAAGVGAAIVLSDDDKKPASP